MSDCSGGSCSSCSSCSSDDPDRLPPGMLSRYNINESTADGTLIWVELVEGAEWPHVSDVSAELIAAAKGMDDGRVFAVVFGGLEVKPLYSEIFGYGADSLYHVRERSLESYSPEAYAGCLASIVERVSPAVILIGSTSRGREVAPRLAAMLGTGLTADCTGLSMDGRKLVMTRPAFGGNLLADIECTKFPQMATVRQGSFPRPEKVDGQGTAIYWQYTDGMLKDVLSEEPIAGPSDDIRDAKVLIALGGGIRDRSSIDIAESIASRIGAMVCCSRSLVERGWMPRSRQVGMSGRTVTPDIYLAFGISGAVQHRVGMSGSKRIVAINNDPDAPIHGFSDLSLITDADSVLRSLDEKMKKR